MKWGCRQPKLLLWLFAAGAPVAGLVPNPNAIGHVSIGPANQLLSGIFYNPLTFRMRCHPSGEPMVGYARCVSVCERVRGSSEEGG